MFTKSSSFGNVFQNHLSEKKKNGQPRILVKRLGHK